MILLHKLSSKPQASTLCCVSVLSLISAASVCSAADAVDGQVTITLDPSRVRNIGGVTDFDRKQYITVHEGFGSIDFADEDVHYMENDLEVEYGRDGGLLSWVAKETGADPDNPDKPNYADVQVMVDKIKAGTADFRLNPESTAETILCTHPELMHATPDNDYRPWGPRSYQTVAEFTEKTLKAFWPDGVGMPKYIEVLNEPFIHREKNGHTVEELSEQHNVVANHLHKTLPNVMVGGYTAAWADHEARDFQHWETHQKKFMDIAGENMDFWSYHIYDGVNVKGPPSSRTGSNSEAIMDIIDTYSVLKFDVAKPILISEFGGIPRGNMDLMYYEAARSAHMLRSTNGQLMTFMDHPDRLLKVVPYFLGKATWTYGLRGPYEPGQANAFLLWRRMADGFFVKTDLVKYYEFWKGVNGERRSATSSNPDVRVHMLADGAVLNVLLMNIDTEAQPVELKGLDGVQSNKVAIRSLRTHGDAPVLANQSLKSIPTDLTLEVGESILMKLYMDEPIQTTSEVVEERYYATEYLKPIEANKSIQYRIENVDTGKGNAVLRLSVARARQLSPIPQAVRVNGVEIELPNNWAGDQGKRGVFFGMIEFPFPIELVQGSNEIEIIYPDDGGRVACAVLQMNTVDSLLSQTLYDFEETDLPEDAVAENVRTKLVSGLGVTAGERALEVAFPTESLYKKVFFEPQSAWDVSQLGDCSLAMDITNLSNESAQLFMTLKDEGQSVTAHVNVAAEHSGTYYIDLANPNQALNLGMTGWPARLAQEVGGVPFQYAWGARQLDPSSISHIGLFMKGNLSERRLVFDNIRIVSNPSKDAVDLVGLVDQYGQYTGAEWSGKVKEDQDLKRQAEEEAKALAMQSTFSGRSKFGGWLEGPRLEATGYYRTAKHQGKWTLVDPEGYLYFATGIANTRFSNTATVTGIDYKNAGAQAGAHVTSELRRGLFSWLPEMDDPLAAHYGYAGSIHTGAVKQGQTFKFYTANLQRKYGADYKAKWLEVTIDRMQNWGFTCFGNWTDPAFYGNGRVPYFANGWIRGQHKRVSTGNDYWGPIHDPFDPEFRVSVRKAVQQINEEVQRDPWCVGVFLDNEISWGNNYGDASRFGIVINTLGRDATECPAKAAFVELLKADHGSIEALNQAWGAKLASWDALSTGFEHEGELSAGMREDYSMLSEALIGEYFKVVNRELKFVMPNHLYCGARFADWGLTEEAVRAAAKHTDVVSYNLYTEGLPGHFGEWLEEVDRPSVLGEFHFGSTDRGMFHGGICTASDQRDRGVKYTGYVKSVLESPYFVGQHWFQYVDSPTTGRAIDGENYNSGFVSVTDTPYQPLIQAVQALNRDLYHIRFSD